MYYIIYSDLNMKGHANKSESLKDPLISKVLVFNIHNVKKVTKQIKTCTY